MNTPSKSRCLVDVVVSDKTGKDTFLCICLDGWFFFYLINCTTTSLTRNHHTYFTAFSIPRAKQIFSNSSCFRLLNSIHKNMTASRLEMVRWNPYTNEQQYKINILMCFLFLNISIVFCFVFFSSLFNSLNLKHYHIL